MTFQNMCQTYFFVGTTETAFEAIGLIALEVGDGAHFEPTFLGGREYLEVEGDGRCETHVTAAKTEDMPRQFEPFHQRLHIINHLFE